MIEGIDVSNNNGRIDWDQVAGAGVAFAIAKVSEGVGFVDPDFAGHWAEMKRVGLVRGAYHFARPSRNGPIAEAMRFLAALNAGGGVEVGDFVALDLEDDNPGTPPDLQEWASRWLELVEQQLGFKPMLYSRTEYLLRRGCANDATLAEHGLWLAAFGDARPDPTPGWPFFAIWQYSEDGSVPGVAGDCDLDRFNGTRDLLLRYGKPAASVPV